MLILTTLKITTFPWNSQMHFFRYLFRIQIYHPQISKSQYINLNYMFLKVNSYQDRVCRRNCMFLYIHPGIFWYVYVYSSWYFCMFMYINPLFFIYMFMYIHCGIFFLYLNVHSSWYFYIFMCIHPGIFLCSQVMLIFLSQLKRLIVLHTPL